MITQSQDVIKALANITSQYPQLVEWLEVELKHEMDRLPYAVNNLAVFQGRCQMAKEILDFVKNSPVKAANL